MVRRIGLLAGVVQLCAAVEVPEYMDKYRPLPGTERYTPESLVRNFEDVFNEQLLEALYKELEPLDSIAKNSGALRNHKRVTFWLDREREPRCAVERAVKLLEEFTFPKELGGAAGFGIVGCKYWVQRRTTEENVNFHYDKDEGRASDKMQMVPPPLVGVTHLEDWGAPTLVLNQTTVRNGNVDAPSVPTSGWFVYPKRNKHCIHRGDLHHGAPHDMAAVPVPAGAFRHTIVTSWETEKPYEPNCHFIPDNEIRDGLKGHSVLPPLSPEWSTFGGLSQDGPTEVVPTAMDFGGFSQGPVSRRKVNLFLGEVAHLDVLAAPESGVTYYADWSGGSKDKQSESGGKAFMGVFEMNLLDKAQMNKIFNSRNPIAIIFYSVETQHQKIENLANAVTRELLIRGKLAADPPIETFLAHTKSCSDAMKAFKLRPKDAPIAVIHNTQTDQKWVMEPDDLPLTTKSFGQFTRQVLGGKREPSDVKAAAKARKEWRDATANKQNREI